MTGTIPVAPEHMSGRHDHEMKRTFDRCYATGTQELCIECGHLALHSCGYRAQQEENQLEQMSDANNASIGEEICTIQN